MKLIQAIRSLHPANLIALWINCSALSYDIAITGPWAGALMATHAAGHGIDPFLVLTGLQVVVALGIVLMTNPRTLTPRWGEL